MAIEPRRRARHMKRSDESLRVSAERTVGGYPLMTDLIVAAAPLTSAAFMATAGHNDDDEFRDLSAALHSVDSMGGERHGR